MAISDIVESKSEKPARVYSAAVQDLYVAMVLGNKSAARDAVMQLARASTETMGMAEILGATETLQRVAAISGGGAKMAADRAQMHAFASAPLQTLIPKVTFSEALRDMIDRVPVTLRSAAMRTAQRISELYGGSPVMAFARAAEASVTAEAKDFIIRATREGITERAAGRELVRTVEAVRMKTAAWSEAYARMAFRTNVNTAASAGRFRQVQDPAVKAVIPAFRYDAVGDSDTRQNHRAADGIIMAVDDPAWGKISPPLGHNCRCSISFVSVVELKRMGRIRSDGGVISSRIPAGARPDTGFRHSGRPDLFLGDIAHAKN